MLSQTFSYWDNNKQQSADSNITQFNLTGGAARIFVKGAGVKLRKQKASKRKNWLWLEYIAKEST